MDMDTEDLKETLTLTSQHLNDTEMIPVMIITNLQCHSKIHMCNKRLKTEVTEVQHT